MIHVIKKRDGKLVSYDASKIANAIHKAILAVENKFDNIAVKLDEKYSLKLAHEVEGVLEEQAKNVPSVEDIQDIVEKILIKNNLVDVAKSYILYRDQHDKLRDSKKLILDIANTMEGYLDQSDWRVNENSNVNFSLGGLILHNSGTMTANYWLNRIYSKDIASAHKSGDMHIHDLSMFSGYCFTSDTKVKLLDGTDKTFKELVENYSNKTFWVYSIDENNHIVPGLARNPRLTRENAEIICVRLDNNEMIKCTKDHPFLMRNGQYKQACELQPGDSLMPMYDGFCAGKKGRRYKRLRNPSGKRKYIHRQIAEYFYNCDIKGKPIHHINGNRLDNRPENLLLMTSKDHRGMEFKRTMAKEKWQVSNNSRLQIYNRSIEKRQQISDIACIRERNDNGTFKEYELEYNHKVKSIMPLQNDDVYDITVDKFHNFALSAGVFVHNCAGWSLRDLLLDGLGGVPGKITSKPAKHLSTIINQMVNFLGILQNEWAGAMAFSSFDTYLAPFVKVDKLTYDEVKQHIQSFIFGVNTPSRWGSQSPFTNVTFDWIVPKDLKDHPAIVGGQTLDFTYNDCQAEMDLINKAFLEVFFEGDGEGRGFSYPIPTYNITKDFDWDSDNAKLLYKMTGKYGTPYFQNFINSDLDPSHVRSMCCRLRLDKRAIMEQHQKQFDQQCEKLEVKGGGLFGAAELTGSIGVVTINVARIGFLSSTKEEYFNRLSHIMDLARNSLESKRKVITAMLDAGLFPYSKRYLKHGFKNHFSTIGLIGMNESTLNFMRLNLTCEQARSFAIEVLDFMRAKLVAYQKETGYLYNLEATPGEGTSYRLAKIDKEKFPNIITAGEKEPYYTNSTQLPVDSSDDIFEALDMQDDLQVKYTGGTVFHGFLNESIDDVNVVKNLIKNIASKYRLPYFTLTPTFSICKNHGYLKGEQFRCPKCEAETEVYSRIVGYYRPVKHWNIGKKSEYAERLEFSTEKKNESVLACLTN